MGLHLRPGDFVIYRKSKISSKPGRNAVDIYPAANGDSYTYNVRKYYRVVAIQPDGKVIVCTRKGRQHTLCPEDPGIRRANWLERLLFGFRFPALLPPDTSEDKSSE